jgi:hypothetical protein
LGAKNRGSARILALMSKKNAEFRGEFEIQVFSARGVQGSKNLQLNFDFWRCQ